MIFELMYDALFMADRARYYQLNIRHMDKWPPHTQKIYPHYCLMHDHNKEEGYSGVFYIDVPDKNMGNLYFENGKEYEPIPNRLILFPADLKHGGKPNLSNQSRISMSFNYVRYPEKEMKFPGQEYLKSGIKI